jgi:hypothetical protein
MELPFHSYPARKLSAKFCHICHCGAHSEKTPDDGQGNCPNHVEFHSKNKFEESVHPVGFDVLTSYISCRWGLNTEKCDVMRNVTIHQSQHSCPG